MPEKEPASDVLQAAADWFALLGAEDSDEARLRWQRWLDADATHRIAWARVEAINRQFDLPDATRVAAGKALGRSKQSQRRRITKTLLGLGGLSAATWGLTRTTLVQHGMARVAADYSTRVGETRQVSLADGSQLWLNTGTAVDYDETERRVHLRLGELLIETADDAASPARPFIVHAADATLRAVRTRFDVSYWHDEPARLTVYSGHVEVHLPDAAASPRLIETGQTVALTPDGLSRPEAATLAREAWTRGVLLAEDVPLAAFANQLARYRRGFLFCDPAVAALRVVGGYPLNDPDRVLTMLEAALPIRVTRRTAHWVTLRPR